MKITKTLEIKEFEHKITLVFKINDFKITLKSTNLKNIDWSGFLDRSYYYINEPLTDKKTSFLSFEKIDQLITIKGVAYYEFEFEITFKFDDIVAEMERLDEWYKQYVNF